MNDKEYKAHQERLKKRGKLIQDDIAWVMSKLDFDLDETSRDDVNDILLQAYHLGMDMGIRIGKDEV